MKSVIKAVKMPTTLPMFSLELQRNITNGRTLLLARLFTQRINGPDSLVLIHVTHACWLTVTLLLLPATREKNKAVVLLYCVTVMSNNHALPASHHSIVSVCCPGLILDSPLQ